MTKGDWVSEIKIIIKNIDLNLTFQEIAQMKEIKYKKIIKYKINAYAFKQLKTCQGQMKKGRQIYYGGSFALQAYLKSNNILSLEEKNNCIQK